MKRILFLTLFFATLHVHGSQPQTKTNAKEDFSRLSAIVNNWESNNDASKEVATVLLQPSQNAVTCTFSYLPFNGMTVVELVDASSIQAFDAQGKRIPLRDNLGKAYKAMVARAERSLEKHCALYGEMPEDGELAVTLLKDNKYIVHFGSL